MGVYLAIDLGSSSLTALVLDTGHRAARAVESIPNGTRQRRPPAVVPAARSGTSTGWWRMRSTWRALS